MAFERITVDPDRMGGVSCIRNLRVTVTMILGQLAGGRSIEHVLADYPYLERDDIYAALEYADGGGAGTGSPPRQAGEGSAEKRPACCPTWRP